MPQVFIPPLLKPIVGAESVTIEGLTVRELVESLEVRYPDLAGKIRVGEGMKPGLTVVVDGHVTPRGLLEKVEPASEIHFLPAIGGG